jgi:hypothetical protein
LLNYACKICYDNSSLRQTKNPNKLECLFIDHFFPDGPLLAGMAFGLTADGLERDKTLQLNSLLSNEEKQSIIL